MCHVSNKRASRPLSSRACRRLSGFADFVWGVSNETLEAIAAQSRFPRSFKTLSRWIKKPWKSRWGPEEACAIIQFALAVYWGDKSGVTVESLLPALTDGDFGEVFANPELAAWGAWHPNTRAATAWFDQL